MARTSFLSGDSKREYVFWEERLENELEKNAELVNVTPIIRGLPEGLQTVLHKSGEEFSGEKKTPCVIASNCFKSSSYYFR